MIQILKTELEKLWTNHRHCVISAAVGFVIGITLF